MDLDPQIAETIVTSLKGIINHEINLFDTTGTIIASTDRSRIGTSHDGARLVIRTQQTISIDSENEYRGARHGINVPVVFNGSTVAVIGITGERAEVEPFGNVIKKMTEILIRENWEQITRFDQRERLTTLVNQLRLRHHDQSLTNYLASVLEIDLTRPRRCIVGRFSPKQAAAPEGTDGPAAGGDPLPAVAESPHAAVYARFQALKESFFSVSDQELCLFIGERDERALAGLVRGIQRDCAKRLGLDIVLGIGDVAPEATSYWRSYDEARKAAEWLQFSHKGAVARYDELDYGIFLTALPQQDAERFVERVFGGIDAAEVDQFKVVFDAYTRHNGSIIHAAEELFLHKNTLQNRLNKIASETGYNPRDLADYAVLSFAFMLRDHLSYEGR